MKDFMTVYQAAGWAAFYASGPLSVLLDCGAAYLSMAPYCELEPTTWERRETVRFYAYEIDWLDTELAYSKIVLGGAA